LLLVRNEDLKAFAHTVAHDLKAPLRGISGYAEELDRKHLSGMSERAYFCLSQIRVATRHLDHLIDDLLHFARLDTATPTFVDLNLRRMIEAILADRSLAIKEHGAEVTVDIPFMTLCSWESGLLQVLANLIDNALKFSRHARPPRIAIRAEAVATGWRLSVSDNGVGFDMKYHARIFGLFNRLVPAEDFEGTGAGLAIVKKVLDKLGGSIRAEAQPGQGATFIVELPRLPISSLDDPGRPINEPPLVPARNT
jgi:signal transduction histidine kinase